MLILAGLGISDERGITLEELEEAKDSDYVFIELYTNIWLGSVEKLEKIIGRKVQILKRKDLEEESGKIISLAKDKKVIIFTPGDPLVATTHSSLLIECMKNKIDFKVLHNSSIISAVCETGLHSYKFGPPVTIPLKERVNFVSSIIETIEQNKKRGLHTLCLLDIDLECNKFLEVGEALKFLLENRAVERKEKIIIASRLGSTNKKILWGNAEDLIDVKADLPAVIVIPGSLHFSEREMLERF